MNESIMNTGLLMGYVSPEVEIIEISSVDIIRTSDEWDLPEIPIERKNPLEIGV